MREEGLTKEMVGRDGFLERAWDWKNTYGEPHRQPAEETGLLLRLAA